MKLLSMLFGLIVLGLGCDALADQPIVIKFSHVVATGTPKGKAAEFFSRRAGELTGGRVRVEVYPDSQLYKDKKEMEALQLGAVQMLAPSLAKFGPLGVREFEVFDLPYIFDSYAELHRVTQGPIGAGILKKLEPRGIVGLAFWDNGFKSFSANTPIRVPSDLSGRTLRIQPSRVLEEQMRALGALPRVMAFSETYRALQSGVVDGTENPHSNMYTQRMHEVQKYMALTEHGYLGYAVIVNKKFWDGLPADVRGQLEAAMEESTAYANRIAREENDAALENIRSSGRTQIHVPTPEELLAFKRVLVPVHRKMESRIGAQVIRDIYRETAFDPSKL